MPLHHVALVRGGRVLVGPDGHLPSLTFVDDDGDRFDRVHDLVGADIHLAPVIRLGEGVHLDVVGVRAVAPPSGTWVEPVDLPGQLAEQVAVAIAEYDGEPPPLRPDWFRPGWYDRVEEWVDGALAGAGRRRTGVMRVVRVWSISAVLRIPTDHGEVWFKAACDLFHGEAGIHQALAERWPDVVPLLVAADPERCWLLMEPMSGTTDADRADGPGLALSAHWPQLQLESLEHLESLAAAGCPARGVGETIEAFHRVLADSPELALLTPEERASLRELAPQIEALVREFWACGIPDSLCHADLHLGNVAWNGEELRVFDLTDACLSHPFLDAEHVGHFSRGKERAGDLIEAMVAPWRSAFPEADVDRALELAYLADLVFQADTFSRIVAASEPASHHELGGVAANLLRAIPAVVESARHPSPP